MRGADIVIVKPVSMAAWLPLIRAYCFFVGDFFGPRLLGASLNYAFLGEGGAVFYWMGFNFFLTRIRIGALPRWPGSCGLVRIFFCFFGFGVVRGKWCGWEVSVALLRCCGFAALGLFLNAYVFLRS